MSPERDVNAVLQMQAFNAWQTPNILAHKWGGGGGPPLGEFNPPPTEGGAGRAGPQAHRFQIRSYPSQLANLKGQAHYAGLGS